MWRAVAMFLVPVAVSYAQIPANLPHTVLAHTAGPVQSTLVAVDPVVGTVMPLPTFPSATAPPQALAQDPYDGALFVALVEGSGGGRVVRLDRSGVGFVETHMVTTPVPVVALAVAGDLLLVGRGGSAGGIWAMPRRGGLGSMVFWQPNLAAMHVVSPTAVTIAWDGVASTGAVVPGTATVDIATGNFLLGPYVFAPATASITGVIDLPTAVPRYLLSFTDGSYAMLAGILSQPPVPVPTTPALPVGASASLQPLASTSIEGVAVGSVTFPYLYTLDAWTGAVVVRSAPLPGDPVDAVFGASTQANVLPFQSACGLIAVDQGSSGLPQLGSTMAFTVLTGPGALVFLAVGLDDFAFGALPASLPGGCALHVVPEVLFAHVADGLGFASQAFAVPNHPALVGTTVFTQWGRFGFGAFSVSAAFAHRVGT